MVELVLYFVFLLIMFLSILVTGLLMNKLIPKLEFWSAKLSKYLITKKVNNYNKLLSVSEVIFYFATISFILSFIIFGLENLLNFILIMVLYTLMIIFLSSFATELRNKIPKRRQSKLITFFISKKHTYIINRLSLLLGKTGLSLYFYIVGIYLLITGFTVFGDIPYIAGYIIFLMIPVGLAVWVYFISYDKPSQNSRRILSYLLLLVLSAIKSFNDFKILLKIEDSDAFNEYIIFLMLTIFAAIDRLLKSIFDDYGDYKAKVKLEKSIINQKPTTSRRAKKRYNMQ